MLPRLNHVRNCTSIARKTLSVGHKKYSYKRLELILDVLFGMFSPLPSLVSLRETGTIYSCSE
ncbi:hypothetical protein METHB2_200039 [Candidatus Methylobacter favarea]|uniref:Uncharacterized protein n=1 Tax=Candidatus Methylobacter favarea TaxID=2707345 RepID=A0A8S0XI55_9GAMM|nr:hypothetical protein METHB2_200039 [Candidatus Methylobacter favarea]